MKSAVRPSRPLLRGINKRKQTQPPNRARTYPKIARPAAPSLSAGERTRDALIRAGSVLLAKKGLANVSLRMIAARAGYSPALVYKHFPDKDALFQAIREVEFISYLSELNAVYLSHDDAATRIVEMANYALSWSEDRAVIFGFDFLSASSQASKRRRRTAKKSGAERSPAAGRVENLFADAVTKYFEQFARQPVAPLDAADQIIGMVLGVTALPSSTVNGALRDRRSILTSMVTALLGYWKMQAGERKKRRGMSDRQS